MRLLFTKGKYKDQTIPRVGKGDRGHSLEEWMDTDFESNHLVKSIGLTTILAVAGAQ